MRNIVLIVDDSKFNRGLLRETLETSYKIVEAENGQLALDYIEEHNEDICAVLLDIVMPIMDGVTLLRVMNEKALMSNFPVIVVTGEQPSGIVEECFEYGISDFIRKPIKNALIQKRVKKQVELYLQRNEFKEMVERQTKTVRNQYNLLQIQANKLKHINDDIINTIGMIVEFRDLGDSDHISVVRDLTRVLAQQFAKDFPEYKLSEAQIATMVSACSLHDIGKIFIPDSVIKKPGKLSSDEYELVKSHTIRGGEAIHKMQMDDWGEDFVKCCYDIARFHHERYDGKGYPDGLKGEAIPISAQIVSVVDTFQVLTSERVYKKAVSKNHAVQMITQGECGVFSPKLMESFRNCQEKLFAVLDSAAEKMAQSD